MNNLNEWAMTTTMKQQIAHVDLTNALNFWSSLYYIVASTQQRFLQTHKLSF